MGEGEDVDERRSKKSGVRATLVEERAPTRGDPMPGVRATWVRRVDLEIGSMPGGAPVTP